MIAPGRRLAAFGVDAALALMLTGIAISPILAFAPPDFWTRTNPIPLIWALCLIFMGLLNRGNTPGKRWLGLRVMGDGCIICREIRRGIWLLVWAVAALLFQDMTMHAALGALIGVAIAYGQSLRSGAAEFGHNARTGFHVERTGASSL